MHGERVIRHRRQVVVEGVLVGHAGDDDDVLAVRVIDRRARERVLVHSAESFLDDTCPVVGRVDDGLGDVVYLSDEALRDAQHDETAVGACPDAEGLVVPFAGGPESLAGAVLVARVVVGVVVVLVEVPAGDVVDVAVLVVIHAVREQLDEIARVEDAVVVHVALDAIRAGLRGVAADEAFVTRDDGRKARVVCIVCNREDAVAVAVVAFEGPRACAGLALGVLWFLRRLR